MSDALTKHLTQQSKPVSPDQVKNNAGGYVFQVSDKTRLERFLILGTDGGTYYVSEPDLTKQNVEFLIEMIKRTPNLVLDIVVEVSQSGRAYRNTAAIFALFMLFKYWPTKEKPELREALPKVCRTSAHLFMWAKFNKLLGGWNQTKCDAVASWYTSKKLNDLAYQVVKYRQRDGWTHRDLFRLSHPKGIDPVLGNFILQKPGTQVDERTELDVVRAFLVAAECAVPGLGTKESLLNVLDQPYAKNLPWEGLPTSAHNYPEVWRKLFYNGQLQGQALLRNITRLAKLGLFQDMVFARDYAVKLVDEQMIAKTRLHPVQYLNALVVYTEGQMDRRNNRYGLYDTSRTKDWQTTPVIVDALNAGFYASFKHIEPANKRTMLGLDVSGSMWWGTSMCTGVDISAATGAALMAMATARVEPYYAVCAFGHEMKHINVTPNMSINEVDQQMRNVAGGGTDCSLPMMDALKKKTEVDVFAVYTDNETWYGGIHPHKALEEYRQKMGIDAKLVVTGMAATNFTIANPNDLGMLDVVGFDANAPRVIADFSAGRL